MERPYEVLHRRRASAYMPTREIRLYEESPEYFNSEMSVDLVFLVDISSPPNRRYEVPVLMHFYHVPILEMTPRIERSIRNIKENPYPKLLARSVTAIWYEIKVQIEISNMEIENTKNGEING